MKALLNAAVDLCLLRGAPQDLPVSTFLLLLTAVLNLLVGILMSLDARFELVRAILENLFGLGLTLGVLYMALSLRGWLPRFHQTATAWLLSGLLLGLLALPLVAWRHRGESAESELLLLVVFVWSIVVLGHIIRHAFELPLSAGIAAAVLYTLVAWNLLAMLFPVSL
ncbi:MAG: hypothetical protein KZQ76_12265 [Candidatus Thiodiazotropha sp. (ex Epidulcina cf. delphinae)]|nr:hypothetical protein [Candidatus Thiodiazotropha sp. (ex Epidulcina cf. delphinae)]